MPLEPPVLSTTPEGRLPPPLCTPLERYSQPELPFQLELSSLCTLPGGCSLPSLPPRRSGEPHLRLELPVLSTPPEGGSPPTLPLRRSGELHMPEAADTPPPSSTAAPLLPELELPVPVAPSEGCAPPLPAPAGNEFAACRWPGRASPLLTPPPLTPPPQGSLVPARLPLRMAISLLAISSCSIKKLASGRLSPLLRGCSSRVRGCPS